MIFWRLFFEFFKIGALSFGGGMGMISLIHDATVSTGWLTEEELLNMLAIAESTPGPIAVNIATFVGSSQAGMLGSFLATLGVVLPSFIIILLIASIMKNLLSYKPVKAVLSGFRPAIVGLIFGTCITMVASSLFSFHSITDTPVFNFPAIIILISVAASSFLFVKIFKKPPSFIVIILLSSVFGMITYSIF